MVREPERKGGRTRIVSRRDRSDDDSHGGKFGGKDRKFGGKGFKDGKFGGKGGKRFDKGDRRGSFKRGGFGDED